MTRRTTFLTKRMHAAKSWRQEQRSSSAFALSLFDHASPSTANHPGNNRGNQSMAALLANVKHQERKWIGQELHDNVNQILTTTKLFIEMLNPSQVRDQAIKEKTISYVMLAIEEIRRISRELVTTKKTIARLLKK